MFEIILGSHWIGSMKEMTRLQAKCVQKFFIDKPVNKYKLEGHSGYYDP